MSTAVISHLENLRARSAPTASRDLYLAFWPAALVSADMVALTIAAVLARLCMGDALTLPISAVAIVVALFCASGLYQVRAVDPITEIRRVFCSTCLAGLSLTCLQAEYSDRGFIGSGLLWFGIATPLLATFRSVLHWFLIRSGQGLTPAVIIGSRRSASPMRELLTRHKHLGFRPIAIVEAEQLDGCHPVVLAGSGSNSHAAIAIRIAPGVLDRSRQLAQRLLDVTLAATLTILSSPLLLAIALSICLSSRGPVLFRQTRIGRNGRTFHIWKFRSMVVDSESVLTAHLAGNAEAKQEWELTQKLRDDPRILRFGRWLRSSSLDELPQLWNVMRGDMSLVGPRPVVPEEIARYGDSSGFYESVRPGMTGLWQVSGRSNTSYEERVSLDEYYVKNRSVSLDFHILVHTARTLLLREGAC
jgi:lipopolysaccharide/colanic/teichoic acid biosynthesis glycosyltransferase